MKVLSGNKFKKDYLIFFYLYFKGLQLLCEEDNPLKLVCFTATKGELTSCELENI